MPCWPNPRVGRPYLDEFAPQVSLSVDKIQIEPGETITLSWASNNADKLIMNNGMGEQFDLSGTLLVQPIEDSTYTISAYNWAGRATASVMITVKDP